MTHLSREVEMQNKVNGDVVDIFFSSTRDLVGYFFSEL